MTVILNILGCLWKVVAFFIGLKKKEEINSEAQNEIYKADAKASEQVDKIAADNLNLTPSELRDKFNKL